MLTFNADFDYVSEVYTGPWTCENISENMA